MPTATMTSAPKKKRDFFNGSQGLNFSDFRSPEPQDPPEEGMVPDAAYVLSGRRASGSYPPSPPVGFPPPQDVGGHSSADYSLPAPFPSRQSPPGYYSQAGQDTRCSAIPPGFSIPSRGINFDDSAPLAEAPAPYASSSSEEQPSWTGPAQAPSAANGEGEGDDGRKKKRKQRCRMCANHGIYVEIKGHKWYCPYKTLQHNCTKCEITRNRQHFMAQQQKLTREQQQQQHLHVPGGREAEVMVEGGQAPVPVMLPSKPSDFPRMKELLEETDHILDEELFRQIDECVRPRVAHH